MLSNHTIPKKPLEVEPDSKADLVTASLMPMSEKIVQSFYPRIVGHPQSDSTKQPPRKSPSLDSGNKYKKLSQRLLPWVKVPCVPPLPRGRSQQRFVAQRIAQFEGYDCQAAENSGKYSNVRPVLIKNHRSQVRARLLALTPGLLKTHQF